MVMPSHGQISSTGPYRLAIELLFRSIPCRGAIILVECRAYFGRTCTLTLSAIEIECLSFQYSAHLTLRCMIPLT